MAEGRPGNRKFTGETECDWQRVVDLAPKGYVEFNDGNTVIHGPLESIEVDEIDMVVITLKWAARMPYPRKPGFGKWSNSPENRVKRFPNLMVPFKIKNTPEKGPRVQFGLNILFVDEVQSLDPAQVEGLVV